MYHYNTTIMNATQARKTAETYNETNLSKELKEIFEKIKIASEKGEFSIEVKNIGKETRAALKKEGYKIIDCSDPRDNYIEWSIQWL